MNVALDDMDDDTGTLVLRFGRDEGFTVTYDDGSAEVRIGLYASEAREVRAALLDLAEAAAS